MVKPSDENVRSELSTQLLRVVEGGAGDDRSGLLDQWKPIFKVKTLSVRAANAELSIKLNFNPLAPPATVSAPVVGFRRFGAVGLSP